MFALLFSCRRADEEMGRCSGFLPCSALCGADFNTLPEVTDSPSSTYRHTNTDWPFSDFPPASPLRGSTRTNACSPHHGFASSSSSDAPGLHVSRTEDQASSRSAAVDAAAAAALSFLMPRAIVDGSKIAAGQASVQQRERDGRHQQQQFSGCLQSKGHREVRADAGSVFALRYGEKKKR